MQAVHPVKLGRYDLVRVRGSGAMGRVYQAFDPALKREVAIKTIRLEHVEDDARAEFIARFRIEAHAAGRLQSPNIVSIHDVGLEGEVAYLVMELVEGQDLREILASNGPVDLGRALQIMRDLLNALDLAHKHGIVHRDIKPANILVDASGVTKLGDFGAARILNSGDATLTGGSVIGTLKYMAPEQLRGDPVDCRVDIYAAGVVLYEMLTGKKPFDGENDYQICQSIMTSKPAPASKLVSGLPREIDSCIERAVSREQCDRFPSAADFWRELSDAFPSLAQRGPFAPFPASGPQTAPAANDTSGRSRPQEQLRLEPRSDSQSGDPSSSDLIIRESELVYWKDVKDSSDPEDLEGFLAIFPKGIYADLAKRKLRQLAASGVEGSNVSTRRDSEEQPRAWTLEARTACDEVTGDERLNPGTIPHAGPLSRDETLIDRRKVDSPRGVKTERRRRERQLALHALHALRAETAGDHLAAAAAEIQQHPEPLGEGDKLAAERPAHARVARDADELSHVVGEPSRKQQPSEQSRREDHAPILAHASDGTPTSRPFGGHKVGTLLAGALATFALVGTSLYVVRTTFRPTTHLVGPDTNPTMGVRAEELSHSSKSAVGSTAGALADSHTPSGRSLVPVAVGALSGPTRDATPALAAGTLPAPAQVNVRHEQRNGDDGRARIGINGSRPLASLEPRVKATQAEGAGSEAARLSGERQTQANIEDKTHEAPTPPQGAGSLSGQGQERAPAQPAERAATKGAEQSQAELARLDHSEAQDTHRPKPYAAPASAPLPPSSAAATRQPAPGTLIPTL